MSDENWTEDDDATLDFESLPDEHPARRARTFFIAVRDEVFPPEALRVLTTPESRPDWGDFVQARDDFRAIPSAGIGSLAKPALGAADVVYVKVLSDVESAHIIREETVMFVPGVFTMIWRPEAGGWLIHRFGEYARPEELPRSSPGAAPTV